MNTELYKKSAWVTAMLARDYMTMPLGSKIGTIAEYTSRFAVSRGVVQSALASLEEQGAVTLRKRGTLGTFLMEIDMPLLCSLSNWNAISGSMPVPMENTRLSGLATAVCSNMKNCPIPFTFAFIGGASNRLAALSRMTYDFIVVSRMSAKRYMEEHDDLEIALTLRGCEYSNRYVLLSNLMDFDGVKDGMRVAVDFSSADQLDITQRLCAGHDVTIREVPYMGAPHVFLQEKENYDLLVYRLDWDPVPPLDYHIIELGGLGLSQEDIITPVIMTNRKNYAITNLLQKYLNPAEIQHIQQEVRQNRRPALYF